MALLDEKIMTLLHELTDSVFQHIEDEQWDKLNTVMMQRHQCITQLMSLHTPEIHDEFMQSFAVIRQHDAEIMQRLTQHADQIKSHLSQLDKTKQYVTF